MTGPLEGVRAVDLSQGRAARIAGMLLADLGAEVVRVVHPDSEPEPVTPKTVSWDRGKTTAGLADDELSQLLKGADVLLIDGTEAGESESRWSYETLRDKCPHLVHVWMPPYTESDESAGLPEDPLLLAAAGGLAVFYPADDDSPIAPVIDSLTHVHGGLGAAAAIAGLIGRSRSGHGYGAVTTGLHAATLVMGTTFVEADGESVRPMPRTLHGMPNYRLYRCADDQWVFMGGLTPEIFFKALAALDRMEVMALPEVAGEFANILDAGPGTAAAAEVLESAFASQPADHWLAQLHTAGVPASAVQTSVEWMGSEIVRDSAFSAELEHPTLGTITTPNVPVTFSNTPATVGAVAIEHAPAPEWQPRQLPATAGPRDERLPLEGLLVVEQANYLAGPALGKIMADYGAEVVKVEPASGDPFRLFSLSFLAYSYNKSGVSLDIKAPGDIARFRDLLSRADLLVENMRSAALRELGLESSGTHPDFPRLVHCSISAFGTHPKWADTPGFDHVLQALTGVGVAQGSSATPVVAPVPFNDVAAAVLGSVGSLAALYQRGRDGRGQRVHTSLAGAAMFVQVGELTTWAGSPERETGSLLHRGHTAGHHYYECADGWVAVAATTPDQCVPLATALDLTDAQNVDAVAEKLRALAVNDALRLLADHGVPACRIVKGHRPLQDPWLGKMSHEVPFPAYTSARVVSAPTRWVGIPMREPRGFFEPGADNAEILGDETSDNTQEGNAS